jgi:hypothetical protein
MVKKIKKIKTMKTIINIPATRAIILLTLLIVFQIQPVNAKSPSTNPSKNTVEVKMSPATPSVATFEDAIENLVSEINFNQLIPKEATFDDEVEGAFDISNGLLKEVAPVTLSEADFDDPNTDKTVPSRPSGISTPLEADFTDF